MGTTNRAEEYADNKLTPKAKEYAITSSIRAVYDNCIEDFNAGFNSRQSEIDELTKEVERLRKEREWISVEDRLPNENCNVIVLTDKGLRHCMWFSIMYKWHILKDNQKVTHWQPLPPINH